MPPTLTHSASTTTLHKIRSSHQKTLPSSDATDLSSSRSYDDFLVEQQRDTDSALSVSPLKMKAAVSLPLGSNSASPAKDGFSSSGTGVVAASGTNPSQKMNFYVLIDGISPFILNLNILKNHHYLQIATQYYSELYDGKPPGPIFLSKAIHFGNGDKWFYFKRRATLQVKFQYEVQLRTPIYEELQSCQESILMGKNPSRQFLNVDEVLRVVSLNRLLLLITDPWAPQYYINVFWCTYNSFTEAKVVLDKLKERWFIPDLLKEEYNYSMQQEIFYNTVVKRKVRQRVAALLHDYVKQCFWHFDDDMVQLLHKFAQEEIQGVFPTLAQKLLGVMASTSRLPPWESYRQKKIPKNMMASMQRGSASRTTSILNIPVKDLAEQLTLLDMRFYNKIHYTEMWNQSWSKAKYRHRAPNLMDHINFLNHVSNWVAQIVCSEPNLNNRKKLIKRFIKTAEHLMKIRSYNMMMAVDSGLSSGPVYRLSLTWDDLDESVLAKREPIAALTSTSDNFKKFRAAMQQAYEQGEPCVPYSGVYLRDLVFTDDGNPTFIDGKVNFNKCIQTYNLFQLVLRFQGRDYGFSELPNLQAEIETHEQASKDELYDLSTGIQPRGVR
uniref:Ras-GEF domain-containing protein n=1 Tax=Percolomonas cosmopolitus TaxID=63605 RepID=A0A7S1KRQ2_9EUKA